MSAVNHGDNIVEIKNLSFSYNEREVLKDINLAVHRGDYLAIVGGNGTGKTTLLKLILGLLKPSIGSIKLFGKDIQVFNDWSKVGYVPQKATAFDPNFPATVEEVVLMGRYGRRGLFHSVTSEDREKTLEALRKVDMLRYRNTLVGDLSGGEQQRVFIAQALAGEPEIMFLDEPTVAIEKNIKEEFYQLLRKLNKELDLTIVLITHDIESMAHQAMHVACLDRTIFFHDSVDKYFESTHSVIHPHS